MDDMTRFATTRLAAEPDARAPDGAEVRLLGALAGGSFAHFRLAPGQVSRAVAHRTVEEIWFVTSGRGEMWRRSDDGAEEVTRLEPGVALTIPLGTTFQFRAAADRAIEAVGVTMPPWPGDDEALPREGRW
jgi:mannose-6-phosphate isomerase-like protein (cupin superfamily)